MVPRSTLKIARQSPQRSRNKPGDPLIVWRVKVSRVRTGQGRWPDAVFVSVRPSCAEIVQPGRQPELPSGDLSLA
jgi:hypothetical protein